MRHHCAPQGRDLELWTVGEEDSRPFQTATLEPLEAWRGAAPPPLSGAPAPGPSKAARVEGELPWSATGRRDCATTAALPPWGTLPAWAVRAVMAILLTMLHACSMTAVIAVKEAGGGGFGFEYVTVTFMQEASKWLVSGLSLWMGAGPGGLHASLSSLARRPQAVMFYGIPGLLYCFETNFQYVILGFLQPTELAILWNFKVFATVVLLHTFLGRRYARQQWTAMAVLVVGCALTQAPSFSALHGPQMKPPGDAWNTTVLRAVAPSGGIGGANGSAHGIADRPAAPAGGRAHSAQLVGAVLALIGSFVAASSNVLCEWLVKRHAEESIHLQNLQLYSFGVLWNALTLLAKVAWDPTSPIHGAAGFFTGYSVEVWLIVFLNATGGITISMALKFADNIVLIFSHAVAVLVVAVISSVEFGVAMRPPFVAGGALVLVALLMFHTGEPGARCDEGCLVATDSPGGSFATSTAWVSRIGDAGSIMLCCVNKGIAMVRRNFAGVLNGHRRDDVEGEVRKSIDLSTARPLPMYCIK